MRRGGSMREIPLSQAQQEIDLHPTKGRKMSGVDFDRPAEDFDILRQAIPLNNPSAFEPRSVGEYIHGLAFLGVPMQ